MAVEVTTGLPATDLRRLAHEFAAEVAGASERKKKTMVSPPGLQLFLLYIRAEGSVPSHQVAGPITVQTVLGRATVTVDDRTFELGEGEIVAMAANAPHALKADQECVLLVTHAMEATRGAK